MKTKIINYIKNSIKYINILILIIFILFIYFNIISINRLYYFITIIILIVVYKLIINYLKYYYRNINLKEIKNVKKIILFNKWRSPLLLLLLIIDEYNYNLVLNYNYKWLKILLFILYIVILNPIRIVYKKYYDFIRMLKSNTIYNIIFIRMFGLILSVLIFTNLINNIKYLLGINIFTLVYIALVIISILNEFKYLRAKFLSILIKINCLFWINAISLLKRKLNTNIITEIWSLKWLEYNIYNLKIETKIYFEEWFKVGSIWKDLNLISNYKNKPTYELYKNLYELIDDDDLIRYYVWFKYSNWKEAFLNYSKYKACSKEEALQFYEIIQYHYILYKIYLFLVWDLMNFLGYDISQTLIVNDYTYLECINFKLNYDFGLIQLKEETYLEKIKDKKEDKFWGNFNIENLEKIRNYDYRTIDKDTIDNGLYLIKDKEFYKYREIVDNIVIKYDDDIVFRQIIMDQDISLWYNDIKKEVNLELYKKEIEEWYQEWLSEQHLDKTKKYEEKLKILEEEWQLLQVKLEI